jgi:hypothetical protein
MVEFGLDADAMNGSTVLGVAGWLAAGPRPRPESFGAQAYGCGHLFGKRKLLG